MDRETLLMVTHTLVISHLDYCNALYVGLLLENSWNVALCYCTGSYECQSLVHGHHAP